MKWDQIESKWAAMTRRVRGDWPSAIKGAAVQGPQKRQVKPRAALSPLGQAEPRIITETDALQAE